MDLDSIAAGENVLLLWALTLVGNINLSTFHELFNDGFEIKGEFGLPALKNNSAFVGTSALGGFVGKLSLRVKRYFGLNRPRSAANYK